jgi:hypothetical protein
MRDMQCTPWTLMPMIPRARITVSSPDPGNSDLAIEVLTTPVPSYLIARTVSAVLHLKDQLRGHLMDRARSAA